MQVNLKQDDVEEAIALFLASMGITARVANVTFKSGRKGSGLTTTVNLEDAKHDKIPMQRLKRSVVNQMTGNADCLQIDGEKPESSAEDGSALDTETPQSEDQPPEEEANVPEDKEPEPESEEGTDSGVKSNPARESDSLFS